ncbi:MAG: phosphoglycerate kinase, partial [Dehalococcoidia bacterium]
LNPSDSTITDDSRIRAVIPTIQYLLDHKAKVILCSHLGRPKGAPDDKLRMAPVGEHLCKILGRPVLTTKDCIGEEASKGISSLKEGEVLLLENLRFHPGEVSNDPEFAKALASLGEIYINDAFGAAHRAHASVVGVTQHLPAVAGLLMEKELKFLSTALNSPARPWAAIIGGAKISDKIAVMEHLLKRVDALLIGGGMAATFLKAQGKEVGCSLIEEGKIDASIELMDEAREKGLPLLLPADVVVAEDFRADAPHKGVPVEQIPPNWYIMDIGEGTVALFEKQLRGCKTAIWNGPMGVFEFSPFSKGTRRLAEILATLDATTIVGGGSTAEAVRDLGLTDKMSHVSTGGGASLEFLEGKVLPGVAALPDV